MNLQKAIGILESHNIWRRGANTEQTDPTQLGIAIDKVVGDYKSGSTSILNLVKVLLPVNIILFNDQFRKEYIRIVSIEKQGPDFILNGCYILDEHGTITIKDRILISSIIIPEKIEFIDTSKFCDNIFQNYINDIAERFE